MRLNTASVAIVLCLIPALGVSDQTKLKVIINGSIVGDNVYDEGKDGAFTSQTDIKIGGIELSGKLDGHCKGGLLQDYTGEAKAPQGSATFTLKDGKLTVTRNGQTNSAPFVDKTGVLAASLHPQFNAMALLAAEKALKSNPALTETSVQAFLVDAGVVLPLKVRSLPARVIEHSGKKLSARMFQMTLAGIDIQCALDDADHLVAEDIPVQKTRFVEEGWEGLFLDPLAKYPELSPPTFQVKREVGVPMKTRDGITLMCDVTRPDDDERHPAILVRTPYGRKTESLAGGFYAGRGYAYVTQDCRGREESGGDWDPFVHEREDGYDTVQWVAAQPWCDGNVGMIGGSYGGFVQWEAAVERPPALKCIVPQVSPPDGMRNIPFDNGVPFLYGDLWWAQIVAGKTMDASHILGGMPNPKGLATLPLCKVDKAALGQNVPFYQRWLQRPTLSAWKGMDYTNDLKNVTIPVLYLSGVWDGDEVGTQFDWATMRSLGRKNEWIMFGPWTHAFDTTHNFGGVEYGPSALRELDSLYLRWFDTWLKGKNVGMNRVPHVQLFVTGANKWVDLADWPDKTEARGTLYLSRGRLRPKPARSAREGYVYDPAKDNIVPANLGQDGSATTKVTFAQLAKRPYLFFKTAPFKRATAIATPVTLDLYFTTSAQSTDFFVDMVDVAPNGEMRIVSLPGKVRTSYSADLRTQHALTPGKIFRANLKPWDFAHEFGVGHRLGVLVRSSEFPGFARNLGTLDPVATATRTVSQHDVILCGGSHPSKLTYYVLWWK